MNGWGSYLSLLESLGFWIQKLLLEQWSRASYHLTWSELCPFIYEGIHLCQTFTGMQYTQNNWQDCSMLWVQVVHLFQYRWWCNRTYFQVCINDKTITKLILNMQLCTTGTLLKQTTQQKTCMCNYCATVVDHRQVYF